LFHALDIFDPDAVGTGVVGVPRVASLPVRVFRALPLQWAYNGYFAVSLFFLLSGFVLTYLMRRPSQAGRAQELVAGRLLRLMPMVVVGSVLAFAVLKSGQIRLDALHRINGATDSDVYPESLRQAGVFKLVRQVLVSVWAGERLLFSRVLWSIGTEFKCSVFLFLFVAAFQAVRSRAAVFVAHSYLGFLMFGFDYLYFSTGSALAEVYERDTWPAFLRTAPALVVMLLFGLSLASVHLKWANANPFLARPDVLLIWTLVGTTCILVPALYLSGFSRLLTCPPVLFLGYLSYPIYAIHQPLLYSVGAGACVALHGQLGYGAAAILATASTLALIVAASTPLARLDVGLNEFSQRFVRRVFGAGASESRVGAGK
jgi:peptidoglycan/LPS O-acetylase OafA/YrhL